MRTSLKEPSPHKSPTRQWRPSTAYSSPNKRKSQLNYTQDDIAAVSNSVFTYPGVNIIKELNGKAIASQDKDIEIERLKTTCFNLNNKAMVASDLQKDLEIMQARLAESEAARLSLEKENKELRKDLSATMAEKKKL